MNKKIKKFSKKSKKSRLFLADFRNTRSELIKIIAKKCPKN